MHHLPRIFALKKQHKGLDRSETPNYKSTNHSQLPDRRRMDQSLSPRMLVRRNAAKNFEYTPSASSSTSPSASGSFTPRRRSLDLPYGVDSTSFRIEGNEGDISSTFEYLQLRPEDFEIPKADYELMKSISAPAAVRRPERDQFDLNWPEVQKGQITVFVEPSPHRFGNGIHTHEVDVTETESTGNDLSEVAVLPLHITPLPAACKVGGINGERPSLLTPPPVKMPLLTHTCKGGGINGERPPLLTPPPVQMSLHAHACKGGGINGERPRLLTPPPVQMSLHTHVDHDCSTWELFEQLGPLGDREVGGSRIGESVIDSGSCSFTNDDDSSSSTTEAASIVSPNSVCRINITQWDQGKVLGKGSFGTVFEGMSSEGKFFAVKVVSLLEEGIQGKQSIIYLEQEIQLLSQFEHENIVQYLGTHKDECKLYIFLELVTQGSLASLYQKYPLRDSHVAAYTRQILLGLKYLHERDVVHRDIKCANILVAANGTVKLADFGLAKATRLNDLKSCKGTSFWMAPEVIRRPKQGCGMAADIWSLGCTVLEMLTGRLPYHPLEFQQAIFRIAKGEPPPLPETLSSDAQDFLLQCLCVNPNDRPTAAELLDHQFVLGPLANPLGSESPMMPAR